MNPEQGPRQSRSRSEPMANTSSPRSLTSTWSERIGSIHMSQPQNMLNSPVGNGTVVNVSVNRGDGETPVTPPPNAQYEDLDDYQNIRADHEIYIDQLLTKKRGFPLWVPGPGRLLPIEYRRQGVSIGDVGILTHIGEFDFLFNIFYPADHPINRGKVPQGFSPLEQDDIHEYMSYSPGTHLASSSVRKISGETTDDHRFECTAKEAAILIMPDGMITRNLRNTRNVRSALEANVKDWYKYARDVRGREVKNGDLLVVTGVDKVSSWGIATSTSHMGQIASFVFRRDASDFYRWECTGGTGRVGPQKSEVYDLVPDDGSCDTPKNQCVFVHTMNCVLPRTRVNSSSVSLHNLDGKGHEDAVGMDDSTSRLSNLSLSNLDGHDSGSYFSTGKSENVVSRELRWAPSTIPTVSGNDQGGIPQLPEIEDPDLFLEVSTHKSLKRASTAEACEWADNDRLSELGSQLLKTFVTIHFFNNPLVRAEEISTRRDLYTSPNVLNTWLDLYGLKNKFRVPPNQGDTIRNDAQQMAAYFHSYVGALFISKGMMEPIQMWISKLISLDANGTGSSRPGQLGQQQQSEKISPIAGSSRSSVSSSESVPIITSSNPSPGTPPAPPSPEAPEPKLAITLVNEAVAKRHLSISYVPSREGPPHEPVWTSRLFINNVERGLGRGKTLQVAKGKAARQAWVAMGWTR